MTNKERSIELLGEKKHECGSCDLLDFERDQIVGYNQMHSKAVKVVEGLLEKNKELLEALREIDERTTYFSRHSNQDSYTELNKIAKQAIARAEE